MGKSLNDLVPVKLTLKLLSVFVMEPYSESYAGFRTAMLAEGRARIRAGVPRETCTSDNRTVSIFKIG